VGVLRDVTESKAREAALQKTRAELAHIARVATMGALTASIAHEVSQPLSGVLTNTRLLERIAMTHPLDVDESVAAARRARRDAERALNVTERLRSLFQKEQAAHAPFDLNDALKDVLSLLSHELVQQPHMELTERLPRVVGDRVQVQQVIVNLLLNAVEAMSMQSTPKLLCVRTQAHSPSSVQLSVSDTGPGVAAHAQKHLFEAFYTTKAKGLGIGLVVSRAIIDSHRGRLWLEPSERGATFCFTLPSEDTT
jgi:C4-dicarboxylate-specific signal transduction histidine kinase